MNLVERDFTCTIALLGGEAAGLVEEVVRQNAPQPGEQLWLVAALEGGEVAMRFQKRHLYHVGGIALAAKVPTDLGAGQHLQIRLVAIEQRLAALPPRRLGIDGSVRWQGLRQP